MALDTSSLNNGIFLLFETSLVFSGACLSMVSDRILLYSVRQLDNCKLYRSTLASACVMSEPKSVGDMALSLQ